MEKQCYNFRGIWIGHPEDDGTCPHFQRTFEIAENCVSAVLRITGLGYFESRINGIPTDSFCCKPLVSEYDLRPLDGILCAAPEPTGQRVYFHTFDLLDRLRPGKNVLEVLLGRGWYCHREKSIEGNYCYGSPKLVFDLGFTYADGRRETVVSDSETLVRSSSIRSDLYRGESWDFTKPEQSFVPSIPAEAPAGRCVETFDCLDTVAEELPPARVFPLKNGFTVDFGCNHSGSVSFRARGPRGARVRVVCGENVFEDGRVDHISTSWGELIQTDEVVLGGWDVLFVPKFAWHGYRFAQFELIGGAQADGIVSRRIHTSIRAFSEFDCDRELLGKLFRVCRNTQVSNMHGGIPSDCPHREKRGYTGDGQATVRSCLYSMDAEEFYRKWLEDILDAQDRGTGYVPHTAPFSGGGGGCGWGHAVTVVPRVLFEFTGDRSVLERSAAGVRRWIEFLDSRHSGDLLIDREVQGWFLGEWFCPETTEINPVFVNTCFFAEGLNNAVFLFEQLGKRAEAERFAALGDRVKRAINRRFFEEDTGSYAGGRQGADVIAVAFGIVPDERMPRVLSRIRERYSVGTDYHLDTGIFGTPLLLEVLTEHGMEDLALRIMEQKDFPSYGNMVAGEDLTLWECWTRETSPPYFVGDGALCPGYPVSLNHPMFGSVVTWLFESVLGISCRELWRGTISFDPKFVGSLNRACGSVPTRFGNISFSYELDGDELKLRAEVPEGLEGRCFGRRLGSGTHEWKEKFYGKTAWRDGARSAHVGSGAEDGIFCACALASRQESDGDRHRRH